MTVLQPVEWGDNNFIADICSKHEQGTDWSLPNGGTCTITIGLHSRCYIVDANAKVPCNDCVTMDKILKAMRHQPNMHIPPLQLLPVAVAK